MSTRLIKTNEKKICIMSSEGNSSAEYVYTSNTARQVTEATVLCLIITISVVGNISLWIVVLRSKALRTVTNMFILGLSLADLMVATVNMPLTVYSIVVGYWNLSDVSCVVTGFINMLTLSTSVLSLCNISVNRYFMVVRPAQFKDIYSPRNSILMMLAVVTVSILLSTPPLIGWSEYKYTPSQSFCFADWENHMSYAFFMIGCCFGIPFGVMTVSNIFIFRTVRKSRRRVKINGRASRISGFSFKNNSDCAFPGIVNAEVLTEINIDHVMRSSYDGNTSGVQEEIPKVEKRPPAAEFRKRHNASFNVQPGNDPSSERVAEERPNHESASPFSELRRDNVTTSVTEEGNNERAHLSAIFQTSNKAITQNGEDFIYEHQRYRSHSDKIVRPLVTIDTTFSSSLDALSALSTNSNSPFLTHSNSPLFNQNTEIKNKVSTEGVNRMNGNQHLTHSSSAQSTRHNTKTNATGNDIDISLMETETYESTDRLSTSKNLEYPTLLRPSHRLHRKEEIRLAMTLAVVVLVFVLCWLPYCISMVLSIFYKGYIPREFHMFTLIIGYANSGCNPIIYGVMNRRFKFGFQRLFCFCRTHTLTISSDSSDL